LRRPDKPARTLSPRFAGWRLTPDPAYEIRNLNACTISVGSRKRSAAGQFKMRTLCLQSEPDAIAPGFKTA
ncbi:hypothetical protein QVA39_23880, partial [Raoultella planticola]|uniref:hypothetical protein n=1 Tax=Raoultella planticola TaxID=575 RepID=UPI0025AA953C|nr:hypothetical protein [Raoultella planticola]